MAKHPNRNLHYAIIRNYTADSDLARKGRDWSPEHIFLELGINVRESFVQDEKKKLSSFNTLDKRTKQKQIITNKITYLQKKKIDETLINKLKYKTYRDIKHELSYQHKYNISKKAKLHPSEKEARVKQWGEWSKRDKSHRDTYPFSIKQKAMQINLENNLDINAPYGFGMVFYAFTSNKPEEYFMRKYQFDPHTGEYKEVEKRA